MTTTDETRVARARMRKATALAAVLRQCGADPADLNDDVWAKACAAANVRPPSTTTKALVVDLLEAA